MERKIHTKIKRRIVTAIVLAAMVLATCIPVFSVSEQLIYLPANQIWTKGYGVSHNIAYSYAGAKCHSVYPISGVDDFKRIQCRLSNTLDEVITYASYYVIVEGDSNYTAMRIKEGMLDTQTVFFKFRGNSSAQANAVVSYTGSVVIVDKSQVIDPYLYAE